MAEHTPDDYRRLARQLRDQAVHRLPGPAETMRDLADRFEAKARELERATVRQWEHLGD